MEALRRDLVQKGFRVRVFRVPGFRVDPYPLALKIKHIS